jgi:hypothetical protein
MALLVIVYTWFCVEFGVVMQNGLKQIKIIESCVSMEKV